MAMDHTFFEQAFRAAGEALLDAAGKAGLHMRPATLTRSARARCMASFRLIAAIVRRLLFLLALEIELAPLRPRPARPAVLAEGVEDVTASFGPQHTGFGLSPHLSGPFPDSFRTFSGPRPGGQVPAGPLLARWAQLYRVLKDPDASARRLARTIERWRKAGEPAPMCAPLPGARRLGPELGLVSSLLPQLVGRALQAWKDTS